MSSPDNNNNNDDDDNNNNNNNRVKPKVIRCDPSLVGSSNMFDPRYLGLINIPDSSNNNNNNNNN